MGADRTSPQAALLADAPFARWLDVALIRVRPDEVHVQLPYRDELAAGAGSGAIHRSVVAAFAELAGALLSVPQPGGPPRASRMILEYLADPPAGSGLHLRARTYLGNVAVEIHASDSGVLVARATLVAPPTATDAREQAGSSQPIYPN